MAQNGNICHLTFDRNQRKPLTMTVVELANTE